MSKKVKDNYEMYKQYLRQIEMASLKLATDSSTKNISKDVSKWAVKVSSKAFIHKYQRDLQ